MNRINRITFKDFKFFHGEVTIPFDGKNVLIYGENGSGKSSLYWGLYTILQSALKTSDLEVHKYFRPGGDESLTNRYSGAVQDAYIELEFDGSVPPPTRRISLSGVATRNDQISKEACLGSEFLDYKILSRIHNFHHKKPIDLFDYFINNFLPYIDFGQQLVVGRRPIPSTNIEPWLHFVQNGIKRPARRGPKKDEYDANLAIFNSKLRSYIQNIETLSNSILSDKIKEAFAIKLSYHDGAYRKRTDSTKWKFRNPRIELSIVLPENGIANPDHRKVPNPQSFLNEAKLTSLALALRFAVMDERFVAAYPHILVLDDLLMSMDMSKRGQVLDLILDTYGQHYQMVILTHDRSFYHSALMQVIQIEAEKARTSGEKDAKKLEKAWKVGWKALEMYEGTDGYGISEPKILKYKSDLQKAYRYFKQDIDYAASGNYLRKALEGTFKGLLPLGMVKNPAITLRPLLTIARQYFVKVGFDTSVIDQLNRHLRTSLNPSSHYNPQADFYKREIEEIFSTLGKLELLRNDCVVPAGDSIHVLIESIHGDSFQFEVMVLNDIRIYRGFGPNAPFYYNDSDARDYRIISVNENGTLVGYTHETRGKNLLDFVNGLVRFTTSMKKVAVIQPSDVYEVVFSSSMVSLKDLRMQFS